MNLFDMPLNELKSYKPQLTKEDDFEEFWQRSIEESEDQPLNPSLKQVDYPVEEVEVYDLFFDGFKNSRIYGRYILPRAADKNNKVPVIVMYHGYNWNNLVISDVLHYSLMGYGVLLMDVRGQDINSPDHNFYDNGGAAGWMTKGILNPDNYYYRYVYMDSVRAIDFLMTREEVDHERIIVEGGSQGGGLAIAVGALSAKIKAVMADIPYLSNFRRAIELYNEGPYEEIYHYFKLHDSLHRTEDQVYRTLSYFDGMNLASRIRADVLLSVGLEDGICPPSTAFALYNHLDTNKEIKVYPEYGHGGFSQQKEEKILFLKKIF
ncbi:cephalosporin-C deacetylase [Orenia metallireducens]|uniref:Cephalosporin-C deacetylase n=1 Tax=Orenia metallireducens TaxID=1413210 RepID=A0A285I9M9_9FIRM|nr:acetylxylan esterase [Orenia metallireducens]PRX20668.1 cephalosporin-C deacetylase [Orenia metallireducens]SNY44689.1 cephalosporin-C deacetylase [Orenia metallireducens]